MPVPVTIVCPDDDECQILAPPMAANSSIARSVRTATFVASQYIIVRDTVNSSASLSTLVAPSPSLCTLAISLTDMSRIPQRDVDLLREAGAFRHLRQLRLYPGGLFFGRLTSEFIMTLLRCMPQLRSLLIHAPQVVEPRGETAIVSDRLQLEEYFCSHPTLIASKHVIESSQTTLRTLRTALDVTSPYHGSDLAATLQSLSSLRTLILNIWSDNDRNVLSHFRAPFKAAFQTLTRLTSLTIGIYLTSECDMFDELLRDSPMLLRSLCLRPSDEVSLTDAMEDWLRGLPEHHRALAQLRTLSVWVSHETINATGRPRLEQFRKAMDERLAPRRIAFEFAV